MKKKVWFLIFPALLMLLCACAANGWGASSVHTAEPSPTAEPTAAPTPSPTPAPLTVYGIRAAWDEEVLDLAGIEIDDAGAALSEALPSLPNIRRVNMTDCGLKDEEMGALQEAFPDVTFVWTVRIYNFITTSDTDYFITNPDAGVKLGIYQAGPAALKYCRNMEALDLGHVHLGDVSFIANMPHLKYLILADNNITDLSVLSSLKELEWLELFGSNATDFTPLLGCTALRDLNLCYTYTPGDQLLELLSQMTWLRRLWVTGTNLTNDQLAALREALPDTEVWYQVGDESTGGTWRYDEDYYAMRDAFHMYYMDIDGDTVSRLTDEELAAVHKKYWGY